VIKKINEDGNNEKDSITAVPNDRQVTPSFLQIPFSNFLAYQGWNNILKPATNEVQSYSNIH
jgi:hypothetical protein